MEIRVLGPADIGLVCSALEAVFDHQPQQSLTAEFLNDPRHHLIAAIEAEQIIGIVSAIHYIHPDKPAELWINEVGVSPSHQRRGVGRRLIQFMLAHGKQLGCQNAWVLTHRANEPAMKLYHQAGGTKAAEGTVMFEFSCCDAKTPAACD